MDKPEKIRDYLTRRLAETVGHHTAIAEQAGLSQAAISRFYLGKADPRLGAVQALLDWFDAYDRKAQLPRRSAFFPGDTGGIARRRSRLTRSATAAPLGR